MQGPAPPKLLVECGLEKLRRDYTHLLVTGELAIKETVGSFLSVLQQESLARLESLHTLVEMASCVQTFLSCLLAHQLGSIVHSCLATSRHSGELPTFRCYSLPSQFIRETPIR